MIDLYLFLLKQSLYLYVVNVYKYVHYIDIVNKMIGKFGMMAEHYKGCKVNSHAYANVFYQLNSYLA